MLARRRGRCITRPRGMTPSLTDAYGGCTGARWGCERVLSILVTVFTVLSLCAAATARPSLARNPLTLLRGRLLCLEPLSNVSLGTFHRRLLAIVSIDMAEIALGLDDVSNTPLQLLGLGKATVHFTIPEDAAQ